MSVPVADTPTLAKQAGPRSGLPSGTRVDSVAVGAPPVAPVLKAPDAEEGRQRTVIRLHPDTKERAKYWAARANVSVNEYMAEAVEEKIRRENGDYDLPTLEIARLGQLIDEVRSLSVNVGNLETVTHQGFDSLMGLTRGDNYLLDPEDGELGAGA